MIRKLVFAFAFESLGILLTTGFLLALSGATATQSLILSVLGAAIALAWNFTFNAVFERWEAHQTVRGRPLGLRIAHALLFEGGLTIISVPVVAWWLDIGLLQALSYEIGLIILFVVYTYLFTWGFDRLFGLPLSAR